LIAEVKALKDGVVGRVQQHAGRQPRQVRKWLEVIGWQVSRTLGDRALAFLNAEWRNSVWEDYRRGLRGRYPLSRSSERDATLDDFEQRSYWLRVESRRWIHLEAAGRFLRDLRLWLEGSWLVDAEPQIEVLQHFAGARLSLSYTPAPYVELSVNTWGENQFLTDLAAAALQRGFVLLNDSTRERNEIVQKYNELVKMVEALQQELTNAPAARQPARGGSR